MSQATQFVAYRGLPEEVRTHLESLEAFIGDVDGKDTVISTNGNTCIDNGTIDADDAVKAFNGIVAYLRRAHT